MDVCLYDSGGNILSKTEYAYTTGSLGAAVRTIPYGYDDATWSDLLTSIDGQSLTTDEIGNLLSDGTWTYTWQHGRQLAGMSKSGTDISYRYDADGKRITKTVNGTAYNYHYLGDQMVELTWGSNKLHFTYDSTGPLSVNYNGTEYFYVRNAQGDVTGLVSASGTRVVTYTYDAWGSPLATTGSMASTLGAANPLRYRGYVYDTETGLYYLQSRYYNPGWGRFINADNQVSAGSDLIGMNLFAYCENNPCNYTDPTGHFLSAIMIAVAAKIVAVVVATVVSVAIVVAVAPALKKAARGVASAASKIYQDTKTAVRNANDSIRQRAIEKADERVRAKVTEASKNRYWTATIHHGYVDIGRPLTFNQAVKHVASGGNVFAVTQYEAKSEARVAGGTTGYNNRPLVPEIDKGTESLPGHYRHFHTYNRKGGHVFYLFP